MLRQVLHPTLEQQARARPAAGPDNTDRLF